jgi:hypothetical protein
LDQQRPEIRRVDRLSETDITLQPTTIIRNADLVKKVTELRDQPGGFIYVYGSASMVRRLARGRPR